MNVPVLLVTKYKNIHTSLLLKLPENLSHLIDFANEDFYQYLSDNPILLENIIDPKLPIQGINTLYLICRNKDTYEFIYGKSHQKDSYYSELVVCCPCNKELLTKFQKRYSEHKIDNISYLLTQDHVDDIMNLMTLQYFKTKFPEQTIYWDEVLSSWCIKLLSEVNTATSINNKEVDKVIQMLKLLYIPNKSIYMLDDECLRITHIVIFVFRALVIFEKLIEEMYIERYYSDGFEKVGNTQYCVLIFKADQKLCTYKFGYERLRIAHMVVARYEIPTNIKNSFPHPDILDKFFDEIKLPFCSELQAATIKSSLDDILFQVWNDIKPFIDLILFEESSDINRKSWFVSFYVKQRKDAKKKERNTIAPITPSCSKTIPNKKFVPISTPRLIPKTCPLPQKLGANKFVPVETPKFKKS